MFSNLERLDNNIIERNPEVHITFHNGVKVELTSHSNKKYRVEFWNGEKCEFQAVIGTGFFASPNKKYYVDWSVKVYDGSLLIEHRQLELSQKIVSVMIDTTSIGDTLAWVPQAIEFAKKHSCKLRLCTFHNELFADTENVEFVSPGSTYTDHYASYTIGYYLGEDRSDYTPVDPRNSPLAKVASDILGVSYRELLPSLEFDKKERPIAEKYVCIAIRSTANAKHWHRENGWQDIVDYLNFKGYKVAIIQKEEHHLKNVLDWSGNLPLSERMNQLHYCEFYIGLGSGISWLAWALSKPVILISGFSKPFAEFQQKCQRVINTTVCNGCWNDTGHIFDKGNWNWCPRHENTHRQFECTRSISSIKVIEAITAHEKGE